VRTPKVRLYIRVRLPDGRHAYPRHWALAVPLDSFCVNTQVPGLQMTDWVTPPSLVSGCTPIYIFVPTAQCLFHSAAVARLVPRSDSVVYTRLLFWCLKDP
jgi:hypothetical protein